MTSLDPIARTDFRYLIDVACEPCVSIYMPAHRSGVDTLQGPIRLKNLLRDAERRLEERAVSPPLIRQLLAPLVDLISQYEFWQRQAGGLALFSSRDILRRYRVSFTVPELAIVAPRFHLKPLIPAIEAGRRFYLLALSQDTAKLYEGDQEDMTAIEVPGLPESPVLAAGPRGAERQLHGHTAVRKSSGRRFAIFHGHGTGEEDRKETLAAWFRRVDEAVLRQVGSEPVPLMLAAVDYLCPIYRQASSNPNLLSQEIHGSPDSLNPGELHRLAWSVAAAHFQQDRARAADDYHRLWHTSRASNDLRTIVHAARLGRVKTLFVAVGIQEWGRIDPSASEVVRVAEPAAGDQDLLNLAALETFIAGGAVYAVPPTEVPGRESAAAIFRY